MFREARRLVLFCAILVCLMALTRVSFAQSAPTAPDLRNVTVEPGGTALIAPVTVNVPRQAAPVVNVAAPVVHVAPAQVNIPEELKVKVTESPYLRGDMNITVSSMPDPPEPQSWCVRNLGWCGILGAALVGASVAIVDASGGFDNTVSFK